MMFSNLKHSLNWFALNTNKQKECFESYFFLAQISIHWTGRFCLQIVTFIMHALFSVCGWASEIPYDDKKILSLLIQIIWNQWMRLHILSKNNEDALASLQFVGISFHFDILISRKTVDLYIRLDLLMPLA